MNKNICLVLLATLPVLSACKSNGGGVVDNGAETILYDENNAETLQLKDVVELTKVIGLEDSGPNSLVGSIDELLCVNGVFVVVDKYQNKTIQTFDSNGKFISKISALGNGPHEYIYLRDVCITPKGNIGIVDTQKRRILEFTVDGRYVSAIPLSCMPAYVEFLNNDTLVLNVSCNTNNEDKHINESEIIITDRNMNSIGYFGEDMLYKTNNSNYAISRQLVYKYGGSLYCTLHEDNVIYQVTGNTMKPKYNLKMLPEDLLPLWDEKAHQRDDFLQWYVKQPNFLRFMEFEDYTLLNYSREINPIPLLLYDHKKKQVFELEVSDDEPLLSYYFSLNAVMDDGHSIVTWNSASMVKYREEHGPEIDNELLKEACKGLTEESNPLLFVFTLK